MSLADYEQELVSYIYQRLIYTDCNVGITLHGDTGSGKTTIALSVAELLQEGWTVFYLKGIDKNLSPYLTWHIGTEMFSKQKLLFGGEISFGIDFIPSPLHFEIGGTAKRELINYLLTPSEVAVVSNIKKQAGTNKNILFIADNYDLWDIPSVHLLQKLICTDLKVLPDYRLAILIIENKSTKMVTDISWEDVLIPNISDDDVLFVLRQKGYSGHIKINDIRACAGNDLSLALMAANYYEESDTERLDFNEIMTRRCNSLSREGQDACKILEPLSIIDSYFTKDETAFFLDTGEKDSTKAEYLAEEYLALAEENHFILGNESYHFSNEKVKSFFRSRLSKQEKYQHRRFSRYLQSYHPEDYYNRGKHLKLSLLTSDPKIVIESWQLLFLSYLRRSSEVNRFDDIYKILDDIDSLIKSLPPELANKQRMVMQELLAGYKSFVEFNYKKTLLYLQGITPSRLIPICLAECQRLILLCHVQLAENNLAIDIAADDLYNTINMTDFCEDEQFCRAALVLIDIYLDRKPDSERAKQLKQKFIRIVQQHPGSTVFEEFEACYNRKAALYYSAIVAFQQTAESIRYYRVHHNRTGLYMALCNHAGNALVSGEYDSACAALDECKNMLVNSPGIYYPSEYKIANNTVVLEYLQKEKVFNNDPIQLQNAAREAAKALLKIKDKQKDEVSHVILLNYLGFSALSESAIWISELKNANKELSDVDDYYQFYLHDLNFFCALARNMNDLARKELDTIRRLDSPLLHEYKRIFYVRFKEQERILATYQGRPISAPEYHRMIARACTNIQDPSCQFFGRGFLLSDLQFLSL